MVILASNKLLIISGVGRYQKVCVCVCVGGGGGGGHTDTQFMYLR